MKKTILLVLALVSLAFAGHAQGYIVVNSEKIFKSIPAYNQANTELDELGRQYQKNIDNAYAAIEKLYNEYLAQKAGLSQAARNQRENEIIQREQEVQRYQQQIFGQDGTLLKKRVEMIQPITERVAGIIKQYAETIGVGLVLDVATSQSVLYYSPEQDKTEQIIKLL